jgi:hypothetical protein
VREFGELFLCVLAGNSIQPITLDQFEKEMEKLFSLMTILTGRSSRPRRITISGKSSGDWSADLVQTWRPSPSAELYPFDMLVPLESMGSRAATIFQKWFEDWPLLFPAVEMFLSSCAVTFPSVKFLCLATSVEAFHRATADGKIVPLTDFAPILSKLRDSLPADLPAPLREKLSDSYEFANECSLALRLKSLLRGVLRMAKADYSQTNAKSFIRRVVTARNALAHGREPEDNLSTLGYDLSAICLRLLLLHIGCSEEEIRVAVLRFPQTSLAQAE